MKVTFLDPIKNRHLGYELVRTMNIRIGAKNVHVFESQQSEVHSYGCERTIGALAPDTIDADSLVVNFDPSQSPPKMKMPIFQPIPAFTEAHSFCIPIAYPLVMKTSADPWPTFLQPHDYLSYVVHCLRTGTVAKVPIDVEKRLQVLT